MELADYLRVLRRRWWLIALAVVVSVGGAVGASLIQTPRYTSSTQLLVGGSSNESGTDELVARQLASQRAGAYSLLLPTPPAVAEVARSVGVTGGNPVVTSSADGTSPFIDITVVADSPQAAQKIAIGYGKLTAQVVAKLEQRPSTATVSIEVMKQPGLPAAPSSPNPQRNALIGAAIGLILGLAGALARESLDARLRDSAEIERLTGVTLLGSIPKEHGGDVLPSVTRPRSGRAEAYRHVRTNLEFTSVDGMPRSIVVTSPAPGEGKSSTAANLAVVAARSGRSVVLVDADLRKPMVARNFGIQASVGLSDVLTGRWRWQEALVPVEGENIHVLASGSVPRFPSELVGSSRMAEVIQELEEAFDFVVIDTPPVLPVSDALVIGVNVSGVVVVARMLETRRAALKRAVEAVRKVNAHLLGIVGNAVVRQEEKAYGEGYGYAYGYTSRSPEEPTGLPAVAPAERRPPESHRRGGRHARPEQAEMPQQQVGRLLGGDAEIWPGPTPSGPPASPFAAHPHPGRTSPQPSSSVGEWQAGGQVQPQATQYPSPDRQGSHGQGWDPTGLFGQSPDPRYVHPDTAYGQPGYGSPAVEQPPQRPGPAGDWRSEPWGMPPQGSGPHSPPDALNLDDIFRHRQE